MSTDIVASLDEPPATKWPAVHSTVHVDAQGSLFRNEAGK
jgi:hypothetical protein